MIHLQKTAQWSLINHQIKSELKAPEDQTCRLYPDLSLALMELVQGTMQFMAHKKSLVLMKGASFAHEFLIPQFYRDVMNIQWLEAGAPLLADWSETLKKDTNLALLYEDHPVTGEIYNYAEIEAKLTEKKIFSIRVSYAKFLHDADLTLPAYSIRLCVLENGKVLAHFGSKVKLPLIFSNTLTVPSAQELQFDLEQFKNKTRVDEIRVRDFEQKMQSFGAQLWAFKGSRSWDRAVLVFPQVSGDWFKSAMVALGQKYSAHIHTLNECNQGFMKPLWNWWPAAPEGDAQRGFVILSAECLTWTDTLKHVENTLQLGQNLNWKW